MLRLLKSAVAACLMACAASAQEQIGSWAIERYSDPVDDGRLIVALIRGHNTWFGISCRERPAAVMSNVYRMPVNPNAEIAVRVGDNGPRAALWTVDNQIAFNFSVLSLIEEILATDSTELVVRYWTVGGRRITDVFDTTGADRAFEVVFDGCPIR